MAEDDSPNDHQQQLLARLDHLEELLRMQTARLHAVEDWLGIEFRPPSPRDTRPSASIPPSAQRQPATPPRPADASTRTQAHDASTHESANSPTLSGAAHRQQAQQDDATKAPGADTDADAARTTSAEGTQTSGAGWQTAAGTVQTNAGQTSDAGGRLGGGGGWARPRTGEERRRERESARAPGDGRGARGENVGGAGAARAASAESAAWFDLESHIGGSWFNWIGIIAVTFGVAFFLKYAFDNEWIGPTGRVALGAFAGVGVLFAGERLRARGLRQYGYVLTGGGILILYLSVYAAFAFYHLIGQVPAFALMAAVTAMAVLLAARYDALAIAILALVGGFLTPLLLSTGKDNEVGLFSYIALLDAGVLALAYIKEWRSLNYLSFAATHLMVFGWMVAFYRDEKLWPTLFFMSLFFLLYAALPIVHNVLKKRPARWFDITLLSANATFYFGIAYKMLDDANYDPSLGSFALVVSAFYLLLYYTAYSRHRVDRLLVYSLLGASITFFTMAVAIQLDQHWVTIGWAAESVVLTWVGLRSETSAPRRAALLVFLVAAGHWLTHDLLNFAYHTGGDAVFTPLLNARAASCAVLVVVCAATLWLYRRGGATVEAGERRTVGTILVLAANMLALTLLTCDANDYFSQRRALAVLAGASTDALAQIESTRFFTFTVMWTLYGASALVVGIARRITPLRALALVLLALTIIKTLALDLSFYDAAWHTPLFNQTFVALALIVLALAVCARTYARAAAAGGELEERDAVFSALVVVANLLAIVAFSAEALGYFEVRTKAPGLDTLQLRDLRLAQQLSLSLIWMLYGGALLLYGHLRGHRLLRLMALVLLGLTTLKVFLVDLASLDRIYKIISFLVLGVILLAVSYLYQRTRQRETRAESG